MMSLGGHPRNFQEAGESYCSPIQVENRYLPPYMREDETLTNANGKRSNMFRRMAP